MPISESPDRQPPVLDAEAPNLLAAIKVLVAATQELSQACAILAEALTIQTVAAGREARHRLRKAS